MRIGTYNVYKFQGYPHDIAEKSLGELESEARIQHFTEVFKQLDCDVLAIQEGGVSPRMLQPIARNLQYHLVTIPSPLRWPGQLFSRYPIDHSRVFSHFQPDVDVPLLSRCAGAARLQIHDDTYMWVFVLHLHPKDISIREKEAQLIHRWIQQLHDEDEHMVVLGDFNCDVNETLHESLRKSGFVNTVEHMGDGLQPTMDTAGKRGRRAIDHIYVSPSLQDRVQKRSEEQTSELQSRRHLI